MNILQNSQNNIADIIKKNYMKMSRKTIYKIALFILGLPTFIAVIIRYILSYRNNEYKNTKAKLREELEINGIKEELRNRILESTKKKYSFFDKTISKAALEKEVDKESDKQFNEILEDELSKKISSTSILKFNIHTLYLHMLRNKVFLVFSVLSSALMYLLVLLHSNPYIKYVFERLIMMIFVIFGVTFLVFTILYISPSDPAQNVLGELATPEQVQDFQVLYGLDKPYIVQLCTTFKNIATFKLGKSYLGNEDVMQALARKFPVTLQVTVASLLISIALSIIPGVISAMKQYSSFDYIFMLIALFGLSIPNFWLGLILVLQFSIKLGWVPATYTVGNISTIIMPAIVLGTSMSATIARLTRSSMLEVKNQDYILTAKAKGLSNSSVIFKHILGNAMIPIVTAIGLQFGGLLGGSAVIEKVFNISGVGSYIIDKQFIPDIPVVLSGVVYIAIIISLVNLIVDIIYAFLDPRIKSKIKNY